jgi:hypothetical protein
MAGRTTREFDELIAMIRQNINELVEQAAAYSDAGGEERIANRIAEQEAKLAKLIELRDALAMDKPYGSSRSPSTQRGRTY